MEFSWENTVLILLLILPLGVVNYLFKGKFSLRFGNFSMGIDAKDNASVISGEIHAKSPGEAVGVKAKTPIVMQPGTKISADGGRKAIGLQLGE